MFSNSTLRATAARIILFCSGVFTVEAESGRCVDDDTQQSTPRNRMSDDQRIHAMHRQASKAEGSVVTELVDLVSTAPALLSGLYDSALRASSTLNRRWQKTDKDQATSAAAVPDSGALADVCCV